MNAALLEFAENKVKISPITRHDLRTMTSLRTIKCLTWANECGMVEREIGGLVGGFIWYELANLICNK